MPDTDPDRDGPVIGHVRAAVGASLAPHRAVVLAVSGGRDSVVLLDAALAAEPARVRLVATFDHGTGPAAMRAARHVCALARAAGVPVRTGRGTATTGATEADWRVARWLFLRRAARRAGEGAIVATGHTADDQLETVVMRLMRGAGARGLAGMYATTPGVVRPLLGVSASEVAAYAAARGLTWVDDPSNASRRHLRNRVRLDLVPALLRVRPTLGAELLADARRAAACRAELDTLAGALVDRCVPPALDLPAHDLPTLDGWCDGVAVARLADLAEMSTEALAALWPALAARGGVRLDRRGTARVSAFTTDRVAALHRGRAPAGGATVAGGAQVAVERREASGGLPEWAMVVRRSVGQRAAYVDAEPVVLDESARRDGVRFGRWQLSELGRAPAGAELAAGRVAWLAADRRYLVRVWQPGDRWRPAPGGPARRVKRFLADRRVPAAFRPGWPVVVAAGEIVWLPGVRRSNAAPARPGQPGFFLLCERIPERRPA